MCCTFIIINYNYCIIIIIIHDTGKNWIYPSQQMFWNAMIRKGWDWKQEEEISPDVVSEIIKIHNVNNERAWHEVARRIRNCV